jgi:hypothetical protein
MIITKQQAQLLSDLAGQIQDKYGLIIGYSNPTLPSPPMQDADFIIFENPDFEDLHCFHKDDIKTQPMGPYMVRVLPREPEHDEKVENLIGRINTDLLDGVIWFDPGVVRVVDGLEVSVTKKTFPGSTEEIFETNIFTEKYGVVYNYEVITEAARVDRRFRIVKDIIDDTWPRPEKIEPKEPTKLQKFLTRLFDLFGL